jgi:hypothetical protein
MTELQKLATFARVLAQEEPPSAVLPITPTGRMTDTYRNCGFYLCSPGCGKAFRDIASKRAHQRICGRQP